MILFQYVGRSFWLSAHWKTRDPFCSWIFTVFVRKCMIIHINIAIRINVRIICSFLISESKTRAKKKTTIIYTQNRKHSRCYWRPLIISVNINELLSVSSGFRFGFLSESGHFLIKSSWNLTNRTINLCICNLTNYFTDAMANEAKTKREQHNMSTRSKVS